MENKLEPSKLEESAKAIATQGQAGSAVQAYQQPVETGLEDMSKEDMIIPRLVITQPQTLDITPENLGKLYINLTGEYYEEMDMVLIKMKKSRVLFPDDFDRNNKPLCKSDDFMVPSPEIEKPMCSTCQLMPLQPGEKKPQHHCPYANWTANPAGKQKPPKCSETWNLLVVDLKTYMPMFFSLKSTALSPLKRITSAMKMLCAAKNKAAWSMSFNTKIKQSPNTDRGVYYVPDFSTLVALKEEDMENMAAIQRELVNVAVQADYDMDPADSPGAPPAKPADEEF